MADEHVHLPPEAISTWVLTPGPDEGVRQAKHRLAAQVRVLIEKVALIDVAETGVAAVERIAADLGRLTTQVDALPQFPAGAAEAGIDDSRLLERSPLSGACNALAPPLHVELDGDRVVGWAVYGYAYEGPAGCVHGGYVAGAFDDILGCAQMLSGSAGFTGTLTVRMVRPTPLNERIDYEARLRTFEGRKIVVTATAAYAGEVVAEAEGLFITPRSGLDGERMARMALPSKRTGAD